MISVTSHDLIQTIEQLTIRSWHALESQEYDGWLIRFSNGYTGRANSVYPLFPSTLDIVEKIAHCESLYHARQIPIRFKMTAAAYPPELDAVLAEKGYLSYSPTSVQLLDMANRHFQYHPLVQIDDRVSNRWVRDFVQLNDVDQKHLPTVQMMLLEASPDTYFASMQEQTRTIALGMGVIDRNWMALYDIVVHSTYRRRGLGEKIVSSLLSLASERGISNAYLQVVVDNYPAIHLYHKLGFREVYQYWYRIKPGEIA